MDTTTPPSPVSPSASNAAAGPALAPPAPAVAARDSLTAVILVVILGISMQAGSALSVLVIGAVGVIEALWLRTFFAAVILAVVRPRAVRWPARGNRLLMGALTLSLLAMNLCFYEAISRAPVGVVVAVEFLGPLGVAVAGSRRWLDAVWVVLAGVGVFVLADPSGSVSTAGLLFSLASAVCWAAFLLLAKAAVTRMEPLQVTTLMLIGSTVLLTPVFLATGVKVTGQGHAILLGLGVAVLSSALPYLLEMTALKRVRASTYGVLLSLEPGIAALMGFVILAQRLTVREIGGIVAVIVAAAGASWTAARVLRTRVRRVRGP
ncbi:MAG: EamA family transporter [Actinobacteria bacterium]|nr:EamA family transporter [Actinomycetota bacterium]